MNQVAIVFITSGAPLMGELGKNHDVWELKNPRVLQIVQAPGGQQGLAFLPHAGLPDVIFITGDIAYCIPKDKDFINKYIESVTNIRVVSSLPKGN